MSPLIPLVAQTQNQPSSPGGGFFLLPALLLGMLVFIFMTNRSSEKRKTRQREAMYNQLSKNDRVLTIGGVIGTIHSVKDDEVVLKVDESTNTKMTFAKSSIQRIITDDQPLGGEKK
ncbi:MAG: preprotein translocase subunit YajC [Phycisphaerae bacterium]